MGSIVSPANIVAARENDSINSNSSASGSGSSSTEFADTLATCMFFGTSGGAPASSQSGTPSGNTVQNSQTPSTPSTTLMTAADTPSTGATTSNNTTSSTDTSGSTSTPSTTSQTTLTAAQLATMTPDQAYWAEQPPAVQALQNMPDDQRAAYAQQLANEGYTIDVPIMVWGWDPLATMVVRQNDGFTWVPSAMQSEIPVAPGDSFPGLPSYDPNNPPAGSIQVSTAFAIGTNGQDPWITQQQLTASEAMDS